MYHHREKDRYAESKSVSGSERCFMNAHVSLKIDPVPSCLVSFSEI